MSSRTPTYRLHRPSGRAVVTIDGRDFYLGKHRSPDSKAEYDRLISEWLANGRRLPGTKPPDLSVNELLLAYLRWAEGYYRESPELDSIKFGIRQIKALYGHTPATSFGPLSLKAVREAMIAADLCRNEINKRIRRIVRAFKWAVKNELVPSSILHGLKAVDGLRRGRSEARESEPVKLHAERRLKRKTRVQPSQRKRKRKARPIRAPKDRYTPASYGRAIARGCEKADQKAHEADATIPVDQILVQHWHPHQLRHNAATQLRKDFGLDVARVILGHRSPVVTEVYAEVDATKAINVMSKVG